MSNLDEILGGLRRVYLEETLSRAASMTRLVGALESDPGAGAALSSLATHFHGLAGTGTSYGFAEISLLGRLGESDVGARQRFGGACSREETRTWKALISQIEAAATSSPSLEAGAC